MYYCGVSSEYRYFSSKCARRVSRRPEVVASEIDEDYEAEQANNNYEGEV